MAGGFTVHGCSTGLPGIIPVEQKSVHWLSMGAASRNNLQMLYGGFVNSAGNRLTSMGLQRYSQSRQPHGSWLFQDLPGTIPPFHCSNREAVNGGTASGGRSCRRYFWEQPVTKEPAAL